MCALPAGGAMAAVKARSPKCLKASLTLRGAWIWQRSTLLRQLWSQETKTH